MKKTAKKAKKKGFKDALKDIVAKVQKLHGLDEQKNEHEIKKILHQEKNNLDQDLATLNALIAKTDKLSVADLDSIARIVCDPAAIPGEIKSNKFI